MKYITVYTESHMVGQTEGYTNTLRDCALELNVPETELFLEPDPNDGNQYEQVFLKGGLIYGDDPVALIYTEAQYERAKH